MVAQKRFARGLKLNYPEAVALISGQLSEFIRDGRTLAELTEIGTRILGTDDVMPGVAEMIHAVQVEGTLIDGTKLVSVHKPVSKTNLSPELALYGSGLVKSPVEIGTDNSMNVIPGRIETLETPIEYNVNRKQMTLDVTNTGSRPVQAGSHCCFEETNRALKFDRKASAGYRLNIPAGTSVRFEAGETKTVELVEIAGEKLIYGGNSLVNGSIPGRENEIEATMKEKGFL
jgi:urease subunit gamma/beta